MGLLLIKESPAALMITALVEVTMALFFFLSGWLADGRHDGPSTIADPSIRLVFFSFFFFFHLPKTKKNLFQTYGLYVYPALLYLCRPDSGLATGIQLAWIVYYPHLSISLILYILRENTRRSI